MLCEALKSTKFLPTFPNPHIRGPMEEEAPAPVSEPRELKSSIGEVITVAILFFPFFFSFSQGLL